MSVNDLTKEQLIEAVLPGAVKNGDYIGTRRVLAGFTIHQLRVAYTEQVKSGLLNPEAGLEATRPKASEVANSNPEVRAFREQAAKELAEVRAQLIAEQEQVAWAKFFFQHSHDPEGALADNVANRNALTNTAISLTRDGVITLAALNEALGIVSKTLGLVRTAPKTPATKANLAADEATLRNYCRQNRLSYGGESALRMLRDRFGSGFGGADIAQAVQEGIIDLRSETDPEVLAGWDREDYVKKVNFLRNEASPSELRAAAKAEAQQTTQQRHQEQANHSHNITSQMQQGNYLPLPTHWVDGTPIDRRWLIQTSNRNYPLFRELVKRHGSAQITSRIQS